jgi:hypothetical protein
MVSNLPPKGSRTIHVLPIRENTLGAEIFVTVDVSGSPALIELVNGESIEQISFEEDIEAVNRVMRLVADREFASALDDSVYLRMIRTNRGISFCAATRTDWSQLVSLPSREVTHLGLTVFLRHGNDGERLIDGFLNLG